jgi:hypothetical protein
LELVRQHRSGWGRGPVPGADELDATPKRLSAALATEAELVREDVGTFATMGECVLDDGLEPSHALLGLRIVQELLAAVAKRSEEIAVGVRASADAFGITLSCTGWSRDGDDLASVGVVSAAAAELGGSVELTEQDESFTVCVTLPRRLVAT